jgi:hypothetical protein
LGEGQHTLVYLYQAMLKKVTLMNYPVDVVLLLLAEAEDVEGLVGEQHVLLVVDRVDAHLETILGLVH